MSDVLEIRQALIAVSLAFGETEHCARALAALARVEATLKAAESACNICGEPWPEHAAACVYAATARRLVAAEAERDEALGMRDDVRTEARLLRETNWKMTQVKREAERRSVAAEAELAKRDNRLEMVRENLRHIAVSLPRAVLRQKLEDLAALAEPVSATGASGAPQNPARPAPAEPPREEGGRAKWARICQRKQINCTLPACDCPPAPERPETP